MSEGHRQREPLLMASGVATFGSLVLAGYWRLRVTLSDYGMAEPWERLTGLVFAACAVGAVVAFVWAIRTRRTVPDDSVTAAQFGVFFGLLPFGLLVAWWFFQNA
jgi:hypothetical protein